MSGPIRQQLGPCRKRLTDALVAVENLINDNNVADLVKIKPKLEGLMKSHTDLVNLLTKATPATEDEQTLVNELLCKCSELTMDSNEWLFTIDSVISRPVVKHEDTVQQTKLDEKLEAEMTSLKLDADLKRKQIEKLDLEQFHQKKTHVKLPKKPLPTFSGTFIEWTSFWDQYNSMIHTNSDLSTVDKFSYLTSCLQGEAKNLLSGYKIEASQYDSAIKQLKERYDDKEFIIHNHYEALTNLQTSTGNTGVLRQTMNNIDVHMRSLESMGENVENKHMVMLIKSKFPANLNLKLEESRSGAHWSVEKLRKDIQKLILAREKTELIGAASSSNTNDDMTDDYDYTAETLIARDKAVCVYCGANHWSDECQKFKTVEDRKPKVTGRCFICFSTNHKSWSCTSEITCFYCNKKKNHHSSLCPTKFAKVNVEKSNDAELVSVSVSKSGDKVSLMLDKDVLMKTAKVQIKSEISEVNGSGRALLDTGGKHTYITERFAERLGLKIGEQKPINVSTFVS